MSFRKTLGKVLDDSVRGPGGTYDPVRILFSIGGFNGVLTPVAFQIWSFFKGQEWDVAAYCLASGGMIGAIVTAGGLAIASKDKGTAQAAATLSDTAIKEGNA